MGNGGMWYRQGDRWWVVVVCDADRVTDRMVDGG